MGGNDSKLARVNFTPQGRPEENPERRSSFIQGNRHVTTGVNRAPRPGQLVWDVTTMTWKPAKKDEDMVSKALKVRPDKNTDDVILEMWAGNQMFSEDVEITEHR